MSLLKNPIPLLTVVSFCSLTNPLAYAQVFATAADRLEQAPASPLVAQSPKAQEQPRPTNGESPDDWRFTATLYAWAVNLTGNTTVHGNTVDYNASIFDIIQKSDSLLGFMGDFEADKGRFGFYADLVWARIGVPASAATYRNPVPGVTLSAQANAAATISLTIFEAAGLYEVGKWTGSEQSFTALDFYAGGRFWNVSNQINLDLTGSIAFSDPAQIDRSKTIAVADSGNLFWADPMIGLRLRHQFTPSQHAFLKADVGGFGLSGSSLFSWQAEAVYSYAWQYSGYALAADIGYRALSTNVNFPNTGAFVNNIDLVIHGPVIGLTVKF